MKYLFLIFCSIFLSKVYAQTFTIMPISEGKEHYFIDLDYEKFLKDYEQGKLKDVRICEDPELKDPCLKQTLLDNLLPITSKNLQLIYNQGKLSKIGILFKSFETSEEYSAYFEYLPIRFLQYFVSKPSIKGSILTTKEQVLESFAFRHKIISDKPVDKKIYQKKIVESPVKKVQFLMRNKPLDLDTNQYKAHDQAFVNYLAKYIWKLIQSDKIIAYHPDSFQIKIPKQSLYEKVANLNSSNPNPEIEFTYDSLAFGTEILWLGLIKGGTSISFEPSYVIIKWKDPVSLIPDRNICAVKCSDLDKLNFTFKGKNLTAILNEKKQIMYPLKINGYPIKTYENCVKFRKYLLMNQWDKLDE